MWNYNWSNMCAGGLILWFSGNHRVSMGLEWYDWNDRSNRKEKSYHCLHFISCVSHKDKCKITLIRESTYFHSFRLYKSPMKGKARNAEKNSSFLPHQSNCVICIHKKCNLLLREEIYMFFILILDFHRNQCQFTVKMLWKWLADDLVQNGVPLWTKWIR